MLQWSLQCADRLQARVLKKMGAYNAAADAIDTARKVRLRLSIGDQHFIHYTAC
jgi:hypothetical protein